MTAWNLVCWSFAVGFAVMVVLLSVLGAWGTIGTIREKKK